MTLPEGFVHRNTNTLIDPSVPERSVSNISYPNQGHPSTQPLIAGALERKSRNALKGYSSSYYVITPSKYMHEFKDDNDYRKDPTPELSLYLPDCTIGGINGERFNVKGKDASKGKVGGALAMSHELSFRAKSPTDAEKWWTTIREAVGEANVTGSAPTSPVESRVASGQQLPHQYQDSKHPAPVQTQGLPHQDTGYQGSSITPGAGTSAGESHHQDATPKSAGAGAGTPTSGLDRAPGEY